MKQSEQMYLYVKRGQSIECDAEEQTEFILYKR